MIQLNWAIFIPSALIATAAVKFTQPPYARTIVLFFANIAFLFFVFSLPVSKIASAIALSLFIYSLISVGERVKKIRAYTNACAAFACLIALGSSYEQIYNILSRGIPHFEDLFGLTPAIGFSFFILRLLQLCLESATDEITDLRLFKFAAFLSYFPTIAAGPLLKYEDFSRDIDSLRNPGKKEATKLCIRAIMGLGKIFILSPTLRAWSLDAIYSENFYRSGTLSILFAGYCHYFFLYFSFSGYSDVVICVSRMLGINLPENFNYPFLARNPQDFWNRWHITLSTWLKELLFFPITHLLHSIKCPLVVAMTVSIICTFAFAGCWHGDGIWFLYYGLYQAAGFLLFRVFRFILIKYFSESQIHYWDKSKPIAVLSVLVTFHFVVIGFFLFLNRAEAINVLIRSIF